MKQEFKVDGMHCEGCASRVKRIIEMKAPGSVAEVDLAAGRVSVSGNAKGVDLAAIITNAGYKAVPTTA